MGRVLERASGWTQHFAPPLESRTEGMLLMAAHKLGHAASTALRVALGRKDLEALEQDSALQLTKALAVHIRCSAGVGHPLRQRRFRCGMRFTDSSGFEGVSLECTLLMTSKQPALCCST